MNSMAEGMAEIDRQLSNRFIELDPQGYFIIYLDREAGFIDERGLALDPETGKPIPVRGKVNRTAEALYTAKTAKELCIEIFEKTKPCPVGYLDHAAYLGREFVRAELALISGDEYVQD
jgi:dihydropteroate synthase